MSRPPSAADSAAFAWSPLTRRMVSVLILLHVAAVFIGPFAFACRTAASSSPFADGLLAAFRPYVDSMYLNHGYAFFAPNPGPSHLVRYRIEFDDGRPPMEGTFPDLKTQRPRLLYHRHLMLADTLEKLYTPPDPPPPPALDPEAARLLPDSARRILEAELRQQHREETSAWQHRRRVYESFRESLARHLQSVHGGSRVTLTRVRHELMLPQEFEVVGRLDAPHTYRNLPEGLPAPEVIRP